MISNGKQHGSLASSIGKRNYSLLHLQSHFGVKIQIFWFVETVEFTRKIIRISVLDIFWYFMNTLCECSSFETWWSTLKFIELKHSWLFLKKIMLIFGMHFHHLSFHVFWTSKFKVHSTWTQCLKFIIKVFTSQTFTVFFVKMLRILKSKSLIFKTS